MKGKYGYDHVHLLRNDGFIPAKIDNIIKQWIHIIPHCYVPI